MVFHCRCFSSSSSSVRGENDQEYETTTQTNSTPTQTNPISTQTVNSSDLNPLVPDSQTPMSILLSNLAEKLTHSTRIFTLVELEAATENFNDVSVIGEGVYKGVVKSLEHPFDHIQMAVKLVNEEHEEWVMEANVLGAMEHPNLVKLVGYYAKEDDKERRIKRVLVYEYLPNKTVRDHLSTTSEAPLSWTTRLKVAQDVARGLVYLHEEMDFQIIFKDFKSSNILLDDEWNAKLSNYGLAPQEGLNSVSIAVVGTMGYASPEYIETKHPTSISDVWSYGVFLYELITGRLPFDTIRPKNKQKLLEWVKPYLGSKKFQKFIDPRLEGNYSVEAAQKLSFIANKCLSMDPKSRPKMSEVLEMVNQLPSEATNHLEPPSKTPIEVVAIRPQKVSEGSSDHGKKTPKKKTKQKQDKESGSVSRICCACC